LKRYRLNKYQLVIILALLRQRLVYPSPHLSGREVLQLIFDDSFGILQGMTLIDSSSLLVSTGIIIPEPENEEEDLLEIKLRLSDRVFSMIYSTFATSQTRESSRRSRETSYKNNVSYLMDLRKLSLLYQKRATKVFNYDYWDEIGLGVAESVTGIDRQLEFMREQIRVRLERTDHMGRIHTWNFSQQYLLSEEELVILVTLLFQEITEGNAYLNAVDLIRLTSKNEEDLLRKRRFFSPNNTLVGKNLVQLDEMINGKELTAEVFLPNWVLEKMLSGEKQDGSPGIDADARLDFHRYLQDIESSEDFLNDMDM